MKPIFHRAAALSVWFAPLLLLSACTGNQPKVNECYSCVASYYGKDWHGQQTANGEVFDHTALTAAHKKLPFDTKVRVTNPKNGKSVVVRINDRGPYVKGREFDLSEAAAKKLGMTHEGVCRVRVEILELGKGRYIHPRKRKKLARQKKLEEKKRQEKAKNSPPPPPKLRKEILEKSLV
jgi:rare lipoprotein A